MLRRRTASVFVSLGHDEMIELRSQISRRIHILYYHQRSVQRARCANNPHTHTHIHPYIFNSLEPRRCANIHHHQELTDLNTTCNFLRWMESFFPSCVWILKLSPSTCTRSYAKLMIIAPSSDTPFFFHRQSQHAAHRLVLVFFSGNI